MNQDIKLKKLCQKGPSAKLINAFCAIHGDLAVIDAEGLCLLGELHDYQRVPILFESDHVLGWVSGRQVDYAKVLAGLIAYCAQKEVEAKALAQETLAKYKELTLLYELGEKIAACLDSDDLAKLALEEARRLLPAAYELSLAVLLHHEDKQHFQVVASLGEIYQTGQFITEIDGISQQVLTTGNAEIVNSVHHDPRFQANAGNLAGIASMLCVPLCNRDKRLGLLMIVSPVVIHFSAGEAKIINLLATQIAVALGRVQLIHERVAQERLQESLKLSRSIQMGMLSTVFPRFSEGYNIDVFAFMEPAREVSGDFYDFFQLDADTLLLVIGDVSDKGVPAALFMVMVKTLIRAMAKHYQQPEQILAALNPELCRDNDAAMFVTLFVATLDMKTGLLCYSFAGHNPPMHILANSDVVMLTGDSGMALGIFDFAQFKQQSLVLKPGDSVLLYTDGISEAMNTEQQAYGEHRLQALLTRLNQGNAEQMVRGVLDDVSAFTLGAEQSDDITLLALKWAGQG
ncbi:PP2C family protein-serine/threonine phosphatase [Methylocucumis oryzae]|uniref:PP2C family protein-serine/threonine phosphatase n=1 Tax=Methylocucumis oryzae TaxID=1632867 RepID=UPI000696DBFA|nr:GAF domain-containing SpoIIE family protein phosphatase [Methylocucumis oryzae]